MKDYKLIINADDYGKDLDTTQAIIMAFTKGLCSSTTIMATGSAFEEAVELAKYNNINDRIGIHLNLTEGMPLTESIRRLDKFCDEEGMFSKAFTSKAIRPLGFSNYEKKAVTEEMRAQIEKCIKSGIKLTHADSHHHIHTKIEIWEILKPIFKELNITKVRISRNCGNSISSLKIIYKFLYNSQLNVSGFKTTKYFGCISDVDYLFKNNHKKLSSEDIIEIMVHPLFGSTTELYDLNGMKLEDSIRRIPSWDKAISYSNCL